MVRGGELFIESTDRSNFTKVAKRVAFREKSCLLANTAFKISDKVPLVHGIFTSIECGDTACEIEYWRDSTQAACNCGGAQSP